ncbi:MAG: acyltransferase [Hyphomicrobiales bacterium]|nr:acyltransferase [Hyphomicrobiales bacterium]
MAYLSRCQLEQMEFASLGKNVKISDKASIYEAGKIHIGDNSRIDDFCVVSGKIEIGRNVYIGPFGLIAGGSPGIVFENFVTLAYRTQVFSQSDDYSGATMTNPTVPSHFKTEIKKAVRLCRHSIVGAGSIITPGVIVAEGTSIGAASLVLSTTEAWSIYIGSPARKLKDRKRDLLTLAENYLGSEM